MQRAIAVLTAVLALCLAAPAGAAIKSDNVSLLGKVPDFAGAIGARFSPDGDTMYVTAATGLRMKPRKKPTSESELGTGTAWGTPNPRWGFACPLPGT